MHYTYANKNLQAHADMHEVYKVQLVVETSRLLFRHAIFPQMEFDTLHN